MHKFVLITLCAVSVAFCTIDSTHSSILNTMGFKDIVDNNGSVPKEMQIQLKSNAKVYGDHIQPSDSELVGTVMEKKISFLGSTDSILFVYLAGKNLDKRSYMIMFTSKNIFCITTAPGNTSAKGRYFLNVFNIPSSKNSRRFVIK